jgi:hypothetical protein
MHKSINFLLCKQSINLTKNANKTFIKEDLEAIHTCIYGAPDRIKIYICGAFHMIKALTNINFQFSYLYCLDYIKHIQFSKFHTSFANV